MSKSPKTDFELYVINKVKEYRVALKLSQEDLASILDTNKSFVGQIESPANDAKYNLNHLNIIATAFGCSPKDFMPDLPINNKKKRSNK